MDQHAGVIQDTFVTKFGRLAYRYYPSPASIRTLVCIHGFDRTGRDFDPLARKLRDYGNVVCPDLPGRGDSEWLADKQSYHPWTYAQALAQLIGYLGCERVDCLGTSMGGHVALILAAETDLVGRLIINDIGPFGAKEVFRALARAVRARPREFPTLEAAEAYMRRIHRGFGLSGDDQWRLCTASGVRRAPSGACVFDYDPEICVPLEGEHVQDRDLRAHWRKLPCPALVIRGAESTVLPREVAERMMSGKPNATLVEIAGVGHAPTFYSDDQIRLVCDWLYH
jgi:pimeloyl-ACP methyl ester carboxylesterase